MCVHPRLAQVIDDRLLAALSADPYAAALGVSLDEVRAGYARASLVVEMRHTNAHGALHGGVIVSLADVVHAAASNSHGTVAVAVEVHAELLATAPVGARLTCEGTEVSRTRRTGLYRIEVYAEETASAPARHVATCLGRVVRRDTPILDAAIHDPA